MEFIDVRPPVISPRLYTSLPTRHTRKEALAQAPRRFVVCIFLFSQIGGNVEIFSLKSGPGGGGLGGGDSVHCMPASPSVTLGDKEVSGRGAS